MHHTFSHSYWIPNHKLKSRYRNVFCLISKLNLKLNVACHFYLMYLVDSYS
jgi:hypothetical protein